MISDHIEEKLLVSLRNANFFTLLADESTDEQNREQLSIFIKWPTTSGLQDHFSGIINVKRTDAESFMRAIEMFCFVRVFT